MRDQAREAGPLSPAREAELLQGRDSQDAIDSLVRHNLDVVVEQADAHAERGLSFPDLFQEGTVGLLEAVATYNGNGAFRDFANLHVGLQMDALVAEEDGARQEAAAALEDVRTLDLAQVMLREDLGHEPKPAELADSLGWDPTRVEKAIRWLEEARRRNDELTLEFLEESDLADIVDLGEEERDPRRKLPGAGPDL